MTKKPKFRDLGGAYTDEDAAAPTPWLVLIAIGAAIVGLVVLFFWATN
jgi:hypothetical protein